MAVEWRPSGILRIASLPTFHLHHGIAEVKQTNSDERKQLTPRVLVLVAIGLAIVAAAVLFVSGFAQT